VGWVHIGKNTHVCVVFTGVPGLISTKLSANIERVVGYRWRGGATGRALDLRSTGRGFKPF